MFSDAPDGEHGPLARQPAAYVPIYQRFLVRDKRFTQQYSHIYARRLDGMRPGLKSLVETKWSGTVLCARIIEAVPGSTVAVIGTLYKDMSLKPNILDEFSAERQVTAPPPRANYCSTTDTLVLEDDSGRITLTGMTKLLGHFVSGIVLAVRGTVTESGELIVNDIITHKLPSPAAPARAIGPSTPRSLCLFISGLEFGGHGYNPLATLLLSEFVCGLLGTAKEQFTCSRIARVVICGGLLDLPDDCFSDKTMTPTQQAAVANALAAADLFVSQIASTVPVDVMPGEKDPANYTLPQQPIHRSLLARCARFSTFRPVTNPCDEDLDGIRLIALSGQSVADVMRYTCASAVDAQAAAGEPLKYMEAVDAVAAGACPPVEPVAQGEIAALRSLLEWGHLAPTAPDTLACYPFYESDPFVITEPPHVLVSGNSSSFQTCKVEGAASTRLICVPRFSTTGTAVLLDLSTLECEALRFEGEPTMQAEIEDA